VNAGLNLDALRDLALDVWEDLGRKRLAGVAVGLALALLAITAIVLRPASVPDASADHLPTPAAVEDGVAFTVPGEPQMRMSDVELSAPRDPFRSLDELGDSAAGDQTLLPAGESVQDVATASTSGGGSDDTSSLVPLGDLSPSSPSMPVGDPDTTHGDLGHEPASVPHPPHAPAPEPQPQPQPEPPPVTDYSYAVDIQFGLVDDMKRYATVQRLGLVPSRRVPLIMYLGVGTDHHTAVFMVDSQLSQGGEGTCVPSESHCTFLELSPDPEQDEHHFRDVDGNEYALRLDRLIRTPASMGSLHGRDVAELPGSPTVVDGAR
jgi:hypothetical protein